MYAISMPNTSLSTQSCAPQIDEIVGIREKDATCIWDSGLFYPACIDKSLVRQGDYTGKFVNLQGPKSNDPIYHLPTARVHIRSALITGTITAAVQRNQKVGVLLGRPFVNCIAHANTRHFPNPSFPKSRGKVGPRPKQTYRQMCTPMPIKDRLRQSPLPQSKAELKRRLREFHYYRNTLIPNYNQVIFPLIQLLNDSDQTQLIWTRQAEEAFNALRKGLGEKPRATPAMH